MRLKVKVKLRSQNEGVEELPDGSLMVRLNEIPVEGKANQRLKELVSDHRDHHCGGNNRSQDQQDEKERAPPIGWQETQPVQTIVEHAAKDPEIGDETQNAGDDQRVQRLIVGTIGGCGARLKVAQ